jgi:putative sterol carrier protein
VLCIFYTLLFFNSCYPKHLETTTLVYTKGTVVFTITPDDKVYSLDLSSPTNCKVAEGDVFDGKADLKVICSEEIMGKMINKEIQPQQAFMKGMLKIKGKMNLAMKLTAVLAATRKKLPTSKL